MAQKEFTDLELLHELEPVVEENTHRHLGVFKEWNPHDYIPWSEGKNYKALGGQDWDPEQCKTMDGPWGTWVNRWTAEENRHSIAIRDYLVVTRSVDPVELEKLRIAQMTRGFSPGQNRQGGDELFANSLFDSVAYVSFQELATRVSHRNTGVACAEPIAQELLKHISNDENLHMIFYRNMVEAGLEIAPNQAVQSIHKVLDNFTMPGYTIPGFRRNAVTIATGGVYDPQLHLAEVVQPVLRKWRIFERDDINGEGEWYREDLDRIITDLKRTASDFDEVKAKYLERQARRAERQAAKV
ncbi:acyl-ACP desaturase [Mycobacteroides abscessus]|uniref:acyl-ACP desaturase n=1 Tax=Mycobacteroides abscessus TaxID=36809 RepID=UPI0009A7515A|nr:acyl-ACP desaturase [Mycobacteroides abscessus]